MNPNNGLNKQPDVVYRIQQGLAPVEEIKIYDFFEGLATVDTFHRDHISWEGRRLGEHEIHSIQRAIEQIAVNATPGKVVQLDGREYRLYIKSPKAEGQYMWWGSLPKAWQSLSPLIHALENLVLQREKAS